LLGGLRKVSLAIGKAASRTYAGHTEVW